MICAKKGYYNMAKIKPTVPGETLFGKVNGQSVQLTRDGSVIKNIGYPRLSPTPKQSVQRQKFASLTNRYQFLTPANKSKWLTTSSNYTWTDSAGNVRTRNAVQTYNFCNQNLLLLDLPILEDPKPYADIVQAGITKEPSSEYNFIIKGANTKAEQNYLVYAMVHNSLGAISLQQRPLLVTNLAYDVLGSGVDIGPALKNTFPKVDFTINITVKVIAVNNINGNRDLVGETVYGNFSFYGLSLDILSYYPFNSNANDYFGINNGTLINSASLTSGVVSGGVDLTFSALSAFVVPDSISTRFSNGIVNTPFTIFFWVKANNINGSVFVNKRGYNVSSSLAQYQTQVGSDSSAFILFGNTLQRQYRSEPNHSFIDDTWHCVAFSTNGIDEVLTFIDDSFYNVGEIRGGYTQMTPTSGDTLFGRAGWTDTRSLDGVMSEITFFNQQINSQQFQAIRQANLNGQTILDIN